MSTIPLTHEKWRSYASEHANTVQTPLARN